MPQLLLIAMSGVRIVNPELRALGLTLPGFIERGKVIASMPSLGLLTIAGQTPEHWSVRYLEVDQLDLSNLAGESADLVAVSSLSARVDDAYQILAQFRQRCIKTILGGLHASVMPDEAARHADTVVIGQGEWVWPQIIADFEANQLKPRYDGMMAKNPLEACKLPRYDLLDPDLYNRIPIQTARGCPLDCSFCAASRLISPYKRKSIERVRQEIEALLKIWPKPFVELADDNTFVHKPWSRELAQLFTEYPQVRWFTETDISLADDDNLLQTLSDSGCAQVLIGLESVSDEALAGTDSKAWKKKQRKTYIERIGRIQDAGISVNGCFIFGFDSDTPDTFRAAKDFILESGLSEVQSTLLTPFPGTALHARMRAEGRLLKERFWDQCTLFDVVFQPANFTVSALESEFQGLIESVYSPTATAQRAAKRAAIFRSRTAHA